jgi:sulfite exporter TauE/SafE
MDSCCQGLLEQGPATVELAVLFSTGLLISVGHCVGMCGPIVAAYSSSQRSAGNRGVALTLPLGLYHAGRLSSYMVIGALFGFIGSTTVWMGPRAVFQGGLSIVAGALMALLGLGLLGWVPTRSWVESRGLGRAVACRIRDLLQARSRVKQYGLGVANGLLPCGPVVAVGLGAATSKQPLLGALVMLIYGLGTVPALMTLGFASSWIGPRVRQNAYRMGAAFILLIGMQLALRGTSALGWVGHLRVGQLVVF